nr:uncharacterized protein LOC105949899 [Ipomoea batatas]
MEAVMIYDGIYVFLFTYDRLTHIVQVFCEAWCPMTTHCLQLIGTDIDSRSTPQCCKYLFQAYNYLYNRRRQPGGGHNQKDDGHSIHINEWIEFWSRRSQIYERPLLRKEDKKKSRQKNTQNPNSKVPAFKG